MVFYSCILPIDMVARYLGREWGAKSHPCEVLKMLSDEDGSILDWAIQVIMKTSMVDQALIGEHVDIIRFRH